MTVLLENYSINNRYKPRHGLSLLIDFNGNNILLDVGPDNTFLKNASAKKINLECVKHLFLSHNHIDHTGGINDFIKINNNANIYLMDKYYSKYYIKILFFYFPLGLKLNKKYYSRISQINNDMVIDNEIHFIKNTVSKCKKPTYNKNLFKKENGAMVNDTFEHESILVLEDNNNLSIFSSCSHNGILNIIETVREKIQNKKVKNFIGGLHLFDPPTKVNESKKYLDYLIKELIDMDIIIYTGHCTGRYALNYLRKGLSNKIREINTGMELNL